MMLCDYVFPASGGVRCLTEAHRGSRYCWIHRGLVHGPTPKRIRAARRNRDRDLLPFTSQELRQLAELRDKTK
jgi:hypothetical protein